MKAIPIAMRERILKLYEQGKSSIEIAEFSGFCVAAVCRVRQQFKERGTVKPRTHLCGRKPLLTAERKARYHPGGVWGANGSPVWNFNDGLMATAAGVEL